MAQLLLTAGERPASVYYRGGEVRIDVHDAWHERIFRRLKADIVALHPDKALSGFRRRRNMRRVITVATAYKYAQRNLYLWMLEQELWYDTYGLKPPHVTGIVQVTGYLYTEMHDGSSYVLPAKPQHPRRAVLFQVNKKKLGKPKTKVLAAKAGGK